jgi:hypothetical protein
MPQDKIKKSGPRCGSGESVRVVKVCGEGEAASWQFICEKKPGSIPWGPERGTPSPRLPRGARRQSAEKLAWCGVIAGSWLNIYRNPKQLTLGPDPGQVHTAFSLRCMVRGTHDVSRVISSEGKSFKRHLYTIFSTRRRVSLPYGSKLAQLPEVLTSTHPPSVLSARSSFSCSRILIPLSRPTSLAASIRKGASTQKCIYSTCGLPTRYPSIQTNTTPNNLTTAISCISTAMIPELQRTKRHFNQSRSDQLYKVHAQPQA